MAIRKPSLTVAEARRLSGTRTPDLIPVAASSGDQTPAAPAPVKEQDVQAAVPSPDLQEPFTAADAAVPHQPAVEESQQDEAAARFGLQAPVAPVAAPPAPRPVRAARAAPALPVLPDSHVKLQVFLSAWQPAPGVSPSFDLLSQRYPAAKSLQMILRRALDDYEHKIADGSFTSAPDGYQADPQAQSRMPVHTSRIMAQALLERARKHFDPLGFESARAFGFKLATAALACFFAEEARLKRK